MCKCTQLDSCVDFGYFESIDLLKVVLNVEFCHPVDPRAHGSRRVRA